MNMASPHWKYQKPQKKSSYDNYLRFENDIAKSIKGRSWKFEKNAYNESLFSCNVIEEDGLAVDKIWSVWNVDLRDSLKKKLKPLKANKATFEVTILKHEEDQEETFEIVK